MDENNKYKVIILRQLEINGNLTTKINTATAEMLKITTTKLATTQNR